MYKKAIALTIEIPLFDTLGDPITSGTVTTEILKDSTGTYAATSASASYVDEELWTLVLTSTETDCNRFRVRVTHADLGADVIVTDEAWPTTIDANMIQIGGQPVELTTGCVTEEDLSDALDALEIDAVCEGGITEQQLSDALENLDIIATCPDGLTEQQLSDALENLDLFNPEIDVVDANLIQINGATTPVTALEDQFDGTGLTGDNYPATQAQVGNIGVASASVSTTASSYTLTTGVQSSGTYESTQQKDNVYHIITPSGGNTSFYYEFNVGGGGTGSSITWHGYVQSNGDTATVKVYNWLTTNWDQLDTISGSPGTTQITRSWDLVTAHTGTGVNLNKVQLQFTSATTTAIATDNVICSYAITSQTVGYADGAIWVDTAASNTNTVAFVDGVADNPVSSWAAALSLSAALNINKFHIAGGSSITLTADSSNFEIYGSAYDLALGGQTITNAHIVGARVSGIGVNTGTAPVFEYCGMAAVTLGPSRLYQCGIGRSSGTFTAGSAGQFQFIDCFSLVPGSGTPVLAFNGLGTTTGVNIRRYSGGINVTGDSDVTGSLEVVTGGGQTIVTGGGSWEVRGICRAVTVTLSGSETVQIACVTGPVGISGTATAATVNIYGVHSTVTNTSTGSTVNDLGVSLDTINVEVTDVVSEALENLDIIATCPDGLTEQQLSEALDNLDIIATCPDGLTEQQLSEALENLDIIATCPDGLTEQQLSDALDNLDMFNPAIDRVDVGKVAGEDVELGNVGVLGLKRKV